jgi:pimeloyl-ACP methyl ester carboxylesterase
MANKTSDMSAYVFIHGGNMSTDTWNRLAKSKVHTSDGLMGGRIWDTITPALKARNYQYFGPTLLDENSHNLTDHIAQIMRIITENDLLRIILIAHSYGGMIITGLAGKIPEKISHMVYIDAALPDPGQSLFDIINASGADPGSFVGLEPAAPYVEKLKFDPEKILPIPKTYILCTQSDFACVTKEARKKIMANKQSWTYYELPSSHVPMASMPDKLLPMILAAASNYKKGS